MSMVVFGGALSHSRPLAWWLTLVVFPCFSRSLTFSEKTMITELFMASEGYGYLAVAAVDGRKADADRVMEPAQTL